MLKVINGGIETLSVESEYEGVVTKVVSKEWDELQVGDAMVVLEVTA
jgi:pyruvate/2-oxoglutarate dehydrogenase complex dihydrolipoamide acyltransferase (E2) component